MADTTSTDHGSFTLPTRNLPAPQVRDLPEPYADSGADSVYAVIFEAATAFTDLRRLQILRQLARRGPCTVRSLIDDLSMSEDAVSRHASKLQRRGYVVAQRSGRRVTYQLARDAKSPVHAKLFEIVSQEWAKGASRTS